MAFGLPTLKSGLTIAAGVLLSGLNSITGIQDAKRTYQLVNPDDDSVVLQWDSCLMFDYHNESNISDAPQEEGAFISYNKVATPFTIRTRATTTNPQNRTQFLSDCETFLDDLKLYKFITPNAVYNDVNLISVDYHRGNDSGFSMISVDFVFREVRINKESRYESAKEPSGEKQKSSGQVTPKS